MACHGWLQDPKALHARMLVPESQAEPQESSEAFLSSAMQYTQSAHICMLSCQGSQRTMFTL